MFAAVDVGTNTVRLLLGNFSGGRLNPVRYERRITRLGGGYTEAEGLSPAARERTLDALREFASICSKTSVDNIRAIGTAAFRRACNGAEFAEQLHGETGLPLEIVSGSTEARLTTEGVLLALDPIPTNSLVIDIGGGSTEFSLLVKGALAWYQSYPIGVVRLFEETNAEEERRLISGCLDDVQSQVARFVDLKEHLSLVGTAGTVTTLAAVDMQMTDYDWRRVNNYSLTLDRLRAIEEMLCPLPIELREEIPGLEPGRGDLIMPGLRVIQAVMQRFSLNLITVSDFGLLEGVLLSLFRR